MIHFDFDERYQDELVVGSAISRREGVIFSVVLHGGLLVLLLLLPALPMFEPDVEAIEARRQEQLEREREAQRMVFVQPLLDIPAQRPPERAELSDADRQSQAPQAAEAPANPLPFSLGDSAERSQAADLESEQARGPEAPEPPVPAEPSPPQPEMEIARARPPVETGLLRPPVDDSAATPEPRLPQPPAGGSLGEALRNLQQYVQNETFHNPQGGALDPGATIQFDTKGVDFGPWLRRFVAQVRRNWFIPHAAMTFRGRVVLQFNIHRDGSITDMVVMQPSDIDAFNRAAFNAIRGSNPTEPLPPEYPDPMAFFTVAFYYNEHPPGQVP